MLMPLTSQPSLSPGAGTSARHVLQMGPRALNDGTVDTAEYLGISWRFNGTRGIVGSESITLTNTVTQRLAAATSAAAAEILPASSATQPPGGPARYVEHCSPIFDLNATGGPRQCSKYDASTQTWVPDLSVPPRGACVECVACMGRISCTVGGMWWCMWGAAGSFLAATVGRQLSSGRKLGP